LTEAYARTTTAASAKIRTVRRLPLVTFLVVTFWIASVLVVDQFVDETGQLVLGALTAGVLAGLLALHTTRVRLQTLAVVGIATLGEILGSLVWGLYGYRLENLPAFVPPGHGLVYLAGLSLATILVRRANALLAVAALVAATWGIAGVTVLPAPDVSGSIGCAFLIGVLAWARRPVYAGVFVVVVALELYGTALGTWTWQPTVPGLGLSQGNPPSGVASGYVVFDVLALALVAWLGGVAVRFQSRSGRRSEAPTTAPARINSRAESTFPQTSQSRNPRALPSPST
jgi:hypothetical protein